MPRPAVSPALNAPDEESAIKKAIEEYGAPENRRGPADRSAAGLSNQARPPKEVRTRCFSRGVAWSPHIHHSRRRRAISRSRWLGAWQQTSNLDQGELAAASRQIAAGSTL
jgi:hypothetical protein